MTKRVSEENVALWLGAFVTDFASTTVAEMWSLALSMQRENLNFLTGVGSLEGDGFASMVIIRSSVMKEPLIVDKRWDGVCQLIREEVWWTEKHVLGAG